MPVTVMMLGQGEAVGELSFLERRRRYVTVRCLTKCQLAVLDHRFYNKDVQAI